MQVLVVGRAKTGTTVISKTIHRSIPGAQYALEPKRVLFFEQQDRVGKPFVVKIIFEHWGAMPNLRDGVVHRETQMKFDKVVTIVRDPRDELISRLYFIARGSAQNGAPREAMDAWIAALREKERNPRGVTFASLVERAKALLGVNAGAGALQQAANYYLWAERLGEKAHLLRYEDFMAGRIGALESYLGIALSSDHSVGEHDYTRRSEGTDNWKSFFTEEDVASLRPTLSPQLEKMGYRDWQLTPVEALDPAHGSEYVQRLVAPFYAAGQALGR